MSSHTITCATADDIRQAGLATGLSDAESVYWEFMLGFPVVIVPQLNLSKRYKLAKLYRAIAYDSPVRTPAVVTAIFVEYSHADTAVRQLRKTFPSRDELVRQHQKLALQQLHISALKDESLKVAKAVIGAFFAEKRDIKAAKDRVGKVLERTGGISDPARTGIQAGGHILYTTGKEVRKRSSRINPR